MYASVEDLEKHLELDLADEAEEAAAAQKLEAASAAIDDYLEVSKDFFAPNDAESEKRILGTGASYLTLPAPVRGEVTITGYDGANVPDFDLDGLRLITLDSNGNPSRYIVWAEAYYKITGIWGYAATPPQVKEACLQLAAHFWRNRDKGLSGTVSDMQKDEQFPERDFPRTVRRLLDEFYKSGGKKPSGGLILA